MIETIVELNKELFKINRCANTCCAPGCLPHPVPVTLLTSSLSLRLQDKEAWCPQCHFYGFVPLWSLTNTAESA